MRKQWSDKYWILFLMALAVSFLVVSCARDETASSTASESSSGENQSTLTVFAAASLSDAFQALAEVYKGENPGIEVAFNFAGSNQLATQINQGAPADVFASANWEQMESAIAGGRIDAAAPRRFATNRLVVAFPSENPANIMTIEDLAAPDTLVVLAAEQVPVGRYTLEFLDKAAADPAFGNSFMEDVLANVVSYEENVRAVLNKVALGEADAGIVYLSDVAGVEGISHLEIPDALNSTAEYPIGVLSDSGKIDMAASFVELVLSSNGQAILAEYGFGPDSTP